MLVVGCIHGNVGAGIAVARALERAKKTLDLWIVPDLNPHGFARGTRQNGRGVDLNANWSSQWPSGGRPWDPYYAGPYPFSERETRIGRNLIARVRPRATIWFHQHMNLVWAWGPSTAAGPIYARAAGMRFYHHHWLHGTATNWQTTTCPARRRSRSSCPPAAAPRDRCVARCTPCWPSVPHFARLRTLSRSRDRPARCDGRTARKRAPKRRAGPSKEAASRWTRVAGAGRRRGRTRAGLALRPRPTPGGGRSSEGALRSLAGASNGKSSAPKTA